MANILTCSSWYVVLRNANLLSQTFIYACTHRKRESGQTCIMTFYFCTPYQMKFLVWCGSSKRLNLCVLEKLILIWL